MSQTFPLIQAVFVADYKNCVVRIRVDGGGDDDDGDVDVVVAEVDPCCGPCPAVDVGVDVVYVYKFYVIYHIPLLDWNPHLALCCRLFLIWYRLF